MKVNSQQLVTGLVNYADNEVINSLPTVGKWLLGAGIGIATSKIDEIVNLIMDNTMIKVLNVVDDDGMFDVDLIIDNLKKSANKYGKMTIQVPMIGNLTFAESDVDNLRNYIERG